MELPIYKIQKAVPLRNEEYHTFVYNKISEAKLRIWASVFIINILTADDTDLKVRNFIKHLAYARWKNVDVKVMVGQAENAAIHLPNESAARFMKELGIDVRQFETKEDNSLHSKYMVFDDELIIVGSNNWSPGGFGIHIEDSIAVYSSELVKILSSNFLRHWEQSIRI